ncbi:type VI secretion system protein ImpA [Sinobacterium caligoides]|uniref:Type VI secretion system protein ImpA n=1 Tax=Sinobacterium caligoides TaxID=933926 RepID=A0A3N2DJS2_9GAMM|nr:type VI secretion system protein TssA [Sinobacterium caligoides]ROS00040.1 type VI secretion system protein ImpA [Sinobacterium caligoides]
MQELSDAQSYLSPISSDSINGADIREDRDPASYYYTIKDARNSARAAERAYLFDNDDDVNIIELWQPVIVSGPEILKNVSKDLEVCCWYIEALIRQDGFHGLSKGLEILNGLVQNFWEGIYPLPDEDGIETTVAPITGLNGDGGEGTLLTPIRNCLILPASADEHYTFWQYHQAKEASRISDEEARASRYDELGYTLEEIDNSIANIPAAFYAELIANLENALSQFNEMNQQLRQHCGNDSPPSSNLKNLLEEIVRTLRFATKDKLAEIQSASKEPEEIEATEDQLITSEQTPKTTNALKNSHQGVINNREQALVQLKNAADFFRLYEPHTPIASTIDRAIKWGRMPVSELMMELMPDDQSRALYAQLTGVKLDGSATDKYVAYSNSVVSAEPEEEPSEIPEETQPKEETWEQPIEEDEAW